MKTRTHILESSAASKPAADIRAVLFDLGDTLIEYGTLDPKVIFNDGAQRTHAYLVDRGHGPPAFRHYRKRLYRSMRWRFAWARVRRRDFNSVHVLRDLCSGMGLPDDETSITELAWVWYSPLARVARIEPDLIQTLATFRSAGLKLGIVSNTVIGSAVLDRHLADVGLLDFFPVRIYSSEYGRRKPDRRIFDDALAAMDVDAGSALFIGDRRDTDIAGARRAGMRTALKTGLAATRGPDPDYVVRTIAELMPIVLSAAYTN
jgi:HAD superfamily hydrolase (TIGR01509 family)